ncbi:MAG: lycopene beta-cyclase CrtY [Janthinobacterium lividum]
MDFDLILAGGGLANGLIALRLAATRPGLRVAIVEGGASIGGNHTWSSFEADITPAQVAWTAPLMAHRWDRYSIRFPAHSRTLVSGYRSATSERLADAVAETAATVLTDSAVVALTPTSVTLGDGRVLTARAVIDGRGQKSEDDRAQRGATPALDLRSQKFLGIEVELTAPHGLDGPVIMDATVPQHDGYRFVYTLPFGPRTVLVEDTYYSDGADLAPDLLRQRVFDYIAAQGWAVARVLREEVGVLPIALDGNIAAFWDAGDAGVPVVGLRAALFNPITGYSFPDAVRVADLVAGLPELIPPALYAALRHHSESTWGARKFYRFLNRMLFDAAEPAERYRVLQRFYRLDAALVRRFYAGRSTTWDMLRTLIGRPPVPLGRAIGVLLKS